MNSDDMLYNNNVIEKLAEYYEDDIDVYRGTNARNTDIQAIYLTH